MEAASEAARSGRGRKCLQPRPRSSPEALPAPAGGLETLAVSGRVSPTGCPRLRPGPRLPGVLALRPIPAHPLAAAARGELTAGGQALLGAAVPCATSRGAGGGLRPSGPGSSAPSPRRKGRATTRRHLRGRVTSSRALPPPTARHSSRSPNHRPGPLGHASRARGTAPSGPIPPPLARSRPLRGRHHPRGPVSRGRPRPLARLQW